MFTIWKYKLAYRPEQRIVIPTGARLLCVQAQEQESAGAKFLVPTLWALVNPVSPQVLRIVRMYPTGTNMHMENNYIGTIQIGGLVWHFFDEGEA